jgi:hypothetical protein
MSGEPYGKPAAPPPVPDHIREEEQRYRSERMTEIVDKREELVDEFLQQWLPHRKLHTETIRESFDRWIVDKWPYVPLGAAERGVLLYYITHTPSGRTRILLSSKRGPDKFTECREDTRVSTAALARMREGGDLARRDGESALEYIERITPDVVVEQPKQHVSHAAPPVDEQARLPYADDTDAQDDLFGGEQVDEPGAEG